MGFPIGAGHVSSFMIEGPRGPTPDLIRTGDLGANGGTGPSHDDLLIERLRKMPRLRASIADAYAETFPRSRTLADFLHDAQERIEQSPVRELTLTRGELDRLMSLGIDASEVEEIVRARIDARKQAEPITVESMKAAAERIAYEEIYDVYRHRKEPEGDRLLDVTDRAENLDEACAKLIGLSGLSAEEVEEHELAQFDAGSISELCDRLEDLTGDAYSFSNFETPLE